MSASGATMLKVPGDGEMTVTENEVHLRRSPVAGPVRRDLPRLVARESANYRPPSPGTPMTYNGHVLSQASAGVDGESPDIRTESLLNATSVVSSANR
jgi:hypothetical protein